MTTTIIPDDTGFLQVGIETLGHFGHNVPLHDTSGPFKNYTPMQWQAERLYRCGLNVFPLPLGAKSGYPWRKLQYTRLATNSALDSLLFEGSFNLAVMCGATSRNLFVIDCETVEAFVYHMSEVRRRRIPLWAVTTGRGGHIYLFMREGEVDNIQSGTLKDAEIRGSNCYVLTAGSLHPSGRLYRWYARESEALPQVSLNQINWLRHCEHGHPVRLTIKQRTPNPDRQHRLRLVSPYSPLAKETRDYMKNGALIREGERNNRLFKAACDLCGNGYSLEDARQLLGPPATLSGLGQLEIDRTIQSAFSKPRTPSKPPFARRPTPHWQYALLYIIHAKYRGRNSHTLRALYLAMVERSRIGSNEQGIFRASYRELAQMARIGLATFQRLLEECEADKKHSLFRAVGKDKMSGATLWRWEDRVIEEGRFLQEQIDKGHLAVPSYWFTFSDALLDLDCTERGALGKGAMFLYQYMQFDPEPRMPSELALLCDMTLSQVNYALKKLREFDLVERLPGGWRSKGASNEKVNRLVSLKRPHYTRRGPRRVQRFKDERCRHVAGIIHQARAEREGERFYDSVAHPPPDYEWDAFVNSLSSPPYITILKAGGELAEDPYGRTARWVSFEGVALAPP
ncbi:MAG: bifunctional DNA primase/polymerase [Anaerolineae bacterium]|nr:bifunctional DNA primase/polymerase [Anaerolineae bacterium]MDW8171539.1 bifunctional DNA primase/polymerase [Anaerolineae bacterium]